MGWRQKPNPSRAKPRKVDIIAAHLTHDKLSIGGRNTQFRTGKIGTRPPALDKTGSQRDDIRFEAYAGPKPWIFAWLCAVKQQQGDSISAVHFPALPWR